MFATTLNLLVGSNIKVFGIGREIFEGKLIDCDGYDLVLACASMVSRGCEWAKRKGKNAILSRNAIIGIRRVG